MIVTVVVNVLSTNIQIKFKTTSGQQFNNDDHSDAPDVFSNISSLSRQIELELYCYLDTILILLINSISCDLVTFIISSMKESHDVRTSLWAGEMFPLLEAPEGRRDLQRRSCFLCSICSSHDKYKISLYHFFTFNLWMFVNGVNSFYWCTVIVQRNNLL